MKPRLTPLLLSTALFLSACDETDAVAVRIRLREDFAGTITTSALSIPPAEGLLAQESRGVQWDAHVDVVCASGHFESLSELHLADIAMTAGEAGAGLCYANISLPRGREARWAYVLVPLSADERARSAAALDPSSKSKDVGRTIKIEVTIPATVVANGLTGKTRGVKASDEGAVATLVVPLEVATTAGDPIVWHLTWQK